MLDMGLQKIGKKNRNAEAMNSHLQVLLLWPLFMDGVQLPQGQSHFEEAVYFSPLGSQKFLVLI